MLKDAVGNTLAGQAISWVSSAPAVATVSGSGLATGVAAGTATISATSGGVTGTGAVTVTATQPGMVIDLAVAGVTASSVTLAFTEVSDGTGQPAGYDIRSARGTLSWGTATGVAEGAGAVPLAGTSIGAKRTCTVLGLAAATGYQFQLVAYRGTLGVNAVFGALSNVASGTTGAVTVTATQPRMVTDLAVAGVTASSVTLAFTEVSGCAGQPSRLDIHSAPGTLSLVTTTDVAQGTCAVPLAGTSIGAKRTCTVLGLAAATGYQFQLVAFRFFFNDTATTEIYTLSLHDALPIFTVTATQPGTVTDLAVAGVTASSVTLAFTEVN